MSDNGPSKYFNQLSGSHSTQKPVKIHNSSCLLVEIHNTLTLSNTHILSHSFSLYLSFTHTRTRTLSFSLFWRSFNRVQINLTFMGTFSHGLFSIVKDGNGNLLKLKLVRYAAQEVVQLELLGKQLNWLSTA